MYLLVVLILLKLYDLVNTATLTNVRYFALMSVLTIFTTFVEKNYIMFAVQKDEAGVVSIVILIIKVIISIIVSCTEGAIGTELLKNA